ITGRHAHRRAERLPGRLRPGVHHLQHLQSAVQLDDLRAASHRPRSLLQVLKKRRGASHLRCAALVRRADEPYSQGDVADRMTMPKAAKTPQARTAYLVLGMHRSGTSAATQLLALAGADLPKNVMPGDEHNQKGYFEPWKIALFNDQRLHA